MEEAGPSGCSSDYAEIILVTTGKTVWETNGILEGQVNVELNDIGKQQASAVADRLRSNHKISCVYTSDLTRAMETALIIASRCGTQVIVDRDLREMHFGGFQGLVFATDGPKVCNDFMSITNRRDVKLPGGGESLDQLYNRCSSCLLRIGQKHKGQQVVAVTHWSVIYEFCKRWIHGLPEEKMALMDTSVCILLLSDSGEWILKQWNDVSHLNPTGYLNSKDVVSSANPNYVEIMLVRNGETDWDINGKLEGQLDVGLNDNGRWQAFAVAERLFWKPKISFVYTSDLKRAVETAHIIAKKCRAEVIVDPDLREMHFGVFQGLVHRERAAIKPEPYNASISNKRDIKFPGGGESHNQFHQRFTSSLRRIVQKHKGNQVVVVVTHWTVIKSFYAQCVRKGHPKEKIPNTSVSIFLLAEGGEWKIKQWNDVSHLRASHLRPSSFLM